MQLWGRIGPKLLELSRYHRSRIIGHNGASWRCPLLVAGRSLCSGPRPHPFLETWRGERFVPFRAFAAPVQAKPKPEAKETEGPRLNKAITAPFVRLVTDEGHVVVSRHEALDRAMKLKLDLVEVQKTANPPVCKLMDFHREKYKQQMKEKERMKGKSELIRKGDCKEVRFTIKTEQKDLQMKADMARRLMERGYRVKCMAMGNEDQDLGSLLSRVAAMIEDVSFVESGPRVEKRQAYMIVRHAKFGPSKGKPVQRTAKVAKAASLPQAYASPSSRSDAISTSPDVEVESEFEPESEYEDVDNDGAKEFASADVEEIESEFGERVPWSDFNAQNGSPASSSESFDVNTEFGSKEFASGIHGDHLPDAGLFANDASNGSKTAAIDEIIAGVDNSISFESGRDKDPVRSSGNMSKGSMNSKFVTSEGPRKPHTAPISDPTLESLKPFPGEPRDAKGFILGHTFDGMSLDPETRSVENNLLDGQNHLRGGLPQIKPPKEVFGQVLAGTQHDSPTRRPLRVDQDMSKTIGGLQNEKKPLREERVLSGPTNSSRGESAGVSADSAPQGSYGIFSASKNTTPGDGRSQGLKKNRDTSSSVTPGMPDSNISVNKYNSTPESESTNVRDNGKTRQGGWGVFSRDSSNSNKQRSSTDR